MQFQIINSFCGFNFCRGGLEIEVYKEPTMHPIAYVTDQFSSSFDLLDFQFVPFGVFIMQLSKFYRPLLVFFKVC